MFSTRAFLLITIVGVIMGCARARAARTLNATVSSASAVDTITGLATLPVIAGTADQEDSWFLVTESSDSTDAVRRGINWAPRLGTLRGSRFVQRGEWRGARLVVASGVDFTPERVVVPSDSGFPPLRAAPGSIGRPGYSPLVELADGTVLNAPVIANGGGWLDRVTDLDRALGFATVRLSRGYGRSRTAWYITTESSDAMVAALEHATLSPDLAGLPGAGDADVAGGVRLGLLAIVNGPTRAENGVERHGMRSAMLGEGDPESLMEDLPGSRRYSPLWDLHLAQWSASASRNAERLKLLSWEEAALRVTSGQLRTVMEGKGNPALGPISPVGVVVNCPVIAVF